MAKGITLQELDASALLNLVPHLGTTSNNGDAYSITTSAIIGVNQKFTIKFNAASSSAPTLKINNGTEFPIKKQNGNNAKIYPSVYSLFWDGANFILQGEGGEYGTATAADVLTGKTLGTENGIVNGTLIPGKKYAEGTVTPSASTKSFGIAQAGGGVQYVSKYPIIVSGIGFIPTHIALYKNGAANENYNIIYDVDYTISGDPLGKINGDNGYRLDGNLAYVDGRGFVLPAPNPLSSYKWKAWGD